jgi:Serine dehydrogenase proteinase
MRQRHVVVLYQHRLFGEAIARVLGEHELITVDLLPLDALSSEALAAMNADAIVLEEEPVSGDVKACLLDALPALTVVVGPEANTAEVYERHEVIQATAADIIARIMNGPHQAATKRAPALRARAAAPSEDAS